MFYLALGLILWIGSHLFKRLAPAARAKMGNGGKGLVTALSLAGLALMIWGYRSAEVVNLWTPPSWTTHLNNLLMLLSVFLFALSHSKGRLRARVRHPMLGAVKVWAFAHLLVNGDLASVLLFGGMLVWAVVSVILINRAEPWVPKTPGEPKRDVMAVVITLVVYGVIVGIHSALGVSPFPG